MFEVIFFKNGRLVLNEEIKRASFFWLISTDAEVYSILSREKSFVVSPKEEEVKKKLEMGEAFNVVAPYPPPKEFEGIFIVETVQLDVFTSQERRYIELRVKAGEPREKAEMDVLERSSGVRIYRPTTTFREVIGMRKLKEYVERLKTFGYGSPFFPKAVFFVGVPGTGKSLSAKAIAGETGRYLVELNLSKILETSQPVANLEKILGYIEKKRLSCVLWIDEIEKIFKGGDKEEKLLGRLLTILQDFNTPTGYMIDGFFWITANDILYIMDTHPELFRSGRMDNVFFVDFPIESRAKEIANLYYRKYAFLENPFGNLKTPKLYAQIVKDIQKKLFSDGNFQKVFIDTFIRVCQDIYVKERTEAVYTDIEGETEEELFIYTPAEIEEAIKRIFMVYYRFIFDALRRHKGLEMSFILNEIVNQIRNTEKIRNIVKEIAKRIRPVGTSMKEGIKRIRSQKEFFVPVD